MTFVRFLMLLSLVVWMGGLIFFAFVLAPGAFAVLPTRQLAGSLVSRSLAVLHGMGICSGVLYAVCSMADAYAVDGSVHPLAFRHLLIYVMLVLTLISMFSISPRMLALRNQMNPIDAVPHDDARRVEFNRLHHWSTRLEGSVLVLGLVLLYLTARRMS